MKYGLIGEKLGHSFSKVIHEKIADYTYELKEIPKDGLNRFMKEKVFLGINVTVPYKSAVIPYLDYIDPFAEKIGAVNTVVNREGKLYGYNTDFGGLKALTEKTGFVYSRKKVLVLGSGGTSRTAKAVAEIKAGKVEYRLDKNNIIHTSIGKVSFGAAKIKENYEALLDAIVKAKPAAAKGTYLKSIAISTTMGPGIKISTKA